MADLAEAAVLVRNAQRWRGMRIGLLGGSFNPAHAGHLHISTQAIMRLGLDAIWWLVSPQNPLKSSRDMAAQNIRLAAARLVEHHPRIVATDIEARLGTVLTVETLPKIRDLHPSARFIWLMGEDNLQQFHRWARWQDITRSMPIAVFCRPGYSHTRWSAPVLGALRRAICPAGRQRGWAGRSCPVLVMLNQPRHGASASAIRKAAPDWADRFAQKARAASSPKRP